MPFSNVRSLLLFALLSFPTSAFSAPLQLKVGATLPLTGRIAVVGVDTRRGIEMAIEDFSSSSVVISGVYDDNQHDAKQAASSARKLLDIDHVDALISMWDMADVVAPMTEQKKVPHLAIRWNPHIAEKYRYTFTVEATYRTYAEALLALLKSMSVHTAAVFTEEAQGWILASDYLKQHAADAGIEIVDEERYLPDSPDYRTAVTRATKKKADMLVLLSNPPHTQLLIKQIREAAPKQRFTGYFEIVEPSLVEGIPFIAMFEVTDWFVKKFKTRFGELPKQRAAQAYDIVHALAVTAARTHQKPNPDSLLETLKGEEFRTGAAGPLTISGRAIENKCVCKIAHGDSFELCS